MRIRALRGAGTKITVSIRFRKPTVPGWLTMYIAKVQTKYPFLKDVRVRVGIAACALVIVLAEVITVLQPYFNQPVYALGSAGSLLAPIEQPIANELTYNTSQQVFNFNQGYTPPSQNSSQTNGIQIEATANQNLSKGVSVTDPVNNVSFTMTPQFATWNGQQDGNRIVYPLKDGDGWVVYSMHSIGVKEDILLNKAAGNTSTFSYKLGLGDNLAARLQSDGDLGIYGNTLLSSNISTGSAKDAALLQKARKNAPKNKLLFTIPKPTITALNQGKTGVSTAYTLNGSNLKITVSGLSKAHYPLTIDPSIYVTSAQQFMAGNNETNINFDVADKLIQEGSITGAMFNSWNPTLSLNSSSWGQAAAVAGGNVYVVGGTNADGSASAAVRWAQFNTSTGAIQSANPGTGVCNGWCTQNSYALPSARSNFSLVAYNGYLYAIGGENNNCTTANGTGDGGVCSTVYIAKLGANGEPQLWNPGTGRQSYWYRDTGLTSPRSYTAAVAYDNRMYLLGGKTSSGGVPSISNAAQVANISATGQLGSWSNETALPYYVYGHGAETYNGRIYLVGGSSSTSSTLSSAAPTNQVYYDKVNGNGGLNNWARTTNLVGGARFTDGGNFTTILGGYLYVSGGCTAVTANGYCSNVASDTQLASINADGSLDQWQNDTVSSNRIGHNTVSWQNNIYDIGGCTSQSTLTGQCSNALSTVNYGTINPSGDISNVTQSVASGSSQCSGNKPNNCNLPSTDLVGHMLNATAIINGYLYVAGGCASADCSNTAQDTAYAAIGNNGALTAPANCANDGNTLYGSWCVDSTHNISPGSQGNGSGGVAAAGTAVSGNTMYVVGGKNSNGLTGGIYYATFNTDGSLSSNGWQYEPMSTAGATSVAYDFAYTRANPASAGTAPGNLFIFGGCTDLSGATCSTYTGAVYKCNILADATVSGCSTSNQLQIGTVAGASGSGLAGAGGTVYANYIYLTGGQAPGMSTSSDIYYAKIDNSNNVVAASGNSWSVTSNQTPTSSAYATAFGYNGYLYDIGGFNGANGALNTVAFAKIDVTNGDIGAFTTSATTIGAVWGESMPVTGAHAYVLGGCTAGSPPGSCSNLQASVQTFQIYNDDSGATATFSKASNTYGTDANRIGAGSTVLDGYIYVAGGCVSSSDCTTAVDNVSYAPIGANGNIGTWSDTSGALPAVRAWGKLEAAGGTLYFIGGQDSSGAAQSTVYYATPSSGNISSWGTATEGLGDTGGGGQARTKFGAAVWDNRLYVAGGTGSGAGCSNGVCNTVFVSPQLNTGGNITTNWTSSTAFNVARSGLTVAAYNGNLYVFGGYDGSNYLRDGQYAKLNTSDGAVDNWSYTASLPTTLSGADGFAANGYMYIVGGTTDGTSCTPSTFVAPISANTTTNSGNNPTGVGAWFQANRHYIG